MPINSETYLPVPKELNPGIGELELFRFAGQRENLTYRVDSVVYHTDTLPEDTGVLTYRPDKTPVRTSAMVKIAAIARIEQAECFKIIHLQ